MRLSLTSAALVLALTSSISGAPATRENSLTKRQVAAANLVIADMNDLKMKRDSINPTELAKRESQIVTQILTYIRDTDLSARIIRYLVTDDTFEPIVTRTIIALIRNGTVNINTLLKALNDSGLAVQVIRDLINDCDFYSQIYQLAGEVIGDLADRIRDSIGQGDSSSSDAAKRDLTWDLEKRDEESTLTSLMESLRDSGLASQVVEELITDRQFLSYGASLIQQLFSSGALTIGQVIDAIAQSGLVPSLFRAFLNLDTLRTVVVNALAAAFGRCDGSTATRSTNTASATITSSNPTSTSTGGGSSCKRKRQYV